MQENDTAKLTPTPMYIWICLICHKNSVKETEKFSDSML